MNNECKRFVKGATWFGVPKGCEPAMKNPLIPTPCLRLH